MASEHTSVLVREIVDFVKPREPALIIDATLGLGGHSEAILETYTDTRVIGVDQDPDAISKATNRLFRFGERFTAVKSNFSTIKQAASDFNLDSVNGVIADLGVSSMQLESPERGFSFRSDGPLDMRMDPSSGETAADLLERL